MLPKSSAVCSSAEIASPQASRSVSAAPSAAPRPGPPQKRVATRRRMDHSWRLTCRLGTLNNHLFNACFNWMIPNLYLGNACFTISIQNRTGCLGYQVQKCLLVETSTIESQCSSTWSSQMSFLCNPAFQCSCFVCCHLIT